MYLTLTYAHVLAGACAILLGPVAMRARKRRGLHTQVGNFYFALMTFVCASAVVMSIWEWERNAYLFFVSLFSFIFLARGYWAGRRRREGWLRRHISGMLGSYIALVTAFLVVSGPRIPAVSGLPAWSLWLLPSVLGIPFVGWVQARVRK
jgi:uncharacterized membrane protein